MKALAVILLIIGVTAGPAAIAASNDKASSTTSDTTAKDAKTTAAASQPPAGNTTSTNSAVPATAAAPANPALEAELEQLRELMESQQTALKSQQAEIEALRAQLGSNHPATILPAPAAVAGAVPSAATAAAPAPLNATVADAQNQNGTSDEEGSRSPLSFRIGDAQFTPGGFLDLTSYNRTTNVGSGIGTSFGSIPFNNSANGAGDQSESRFTAQNSRVSLKVEVPVRGGNMTGYIETDFLGNAPTNLNVTSNSNTLRMRLYFADYRRGKWEMLAGQEWSLLTPNRVGIGYMPTDIFFAQDMDTNYQLGLTWARQPQFRILYHPTKNWAMAVSLENPDQYTGGAVTYPEDFAPATGTSLTNQVDTGNGTTSPGYFPDIIAKIARDQHLGKKDLHFEVAGIVSGNRLATPAAIAGVSATQSKTAGGGSFNMNLELGRNFHLIANTFWSDGEARYIDGLGPNFVVGQDAASLNFIPNLIHAGSGVGGFEWQFTKKTMFYGYYGGAYFGRASLTDPTTGKLIGYGYGGSASSNNRAIQEGTLGVIQTIWKNSNYGTLQVITQASYLTRAPWFVLAPTDTTPGAPKNAHVTMAYVDLRYVLP
jgi:hypothetical protein